MLLGKHSYVVNKTLCVKGPQGLFLFISFKEDVVSQVYIASSGSVDSTALS